MQTTTHTQGRLNLPVLMTFLIIALAYWLWRAHSQVTLEIGLACSQLSREACLAAESRYLNNLLAGWIGQMFPWILPFVPAFIYVFFFRWLRKDRST
jgi:hypothetical protein